jgi:hypothetical protein
MFPNLASMFLFIFCLFAGMLAAMEAGRRIGVRRRARDPEGAEIGLGSINGAVFGLMGLLIAFTFSGAAARFDKRRELVVQEANNIGTAYLRLDLLPASAQPALRERFRRYVDARIAVYRALPDIEAARARLAESNLIQAEIWNLAVAATKAVEVNGQAATSLVLASMNEMIDITTTRTVALQTHPPPLILIMLGVLVLGGSLISGYELSGAKQRNLLHAVSFAILMAGVIYIILDMEHPRVGLIRLDNFDQVMTNVRQSIK